MGKQDDFTESKAAELMSIEALDAYLREHCGVPAFRLNFWQQVKSICTELCLGIRESLHQSAKFGSFEVFGLDVIVDADQTVYMLEANRDPSWVCDTAVKKAIIPGMVREMLELVFGRTAMSAIARRRCFIRPCGVSRCSSMMPLTFRLSMLSDKSFSASG